MIREQEIHKVAVKVVDLVLKAQLTEMEQIVLYTSLTKSIAKSCKMARE
jgi:hypothetical protein